MVVYLREDGAVLDYDTKRPVPDGAWIKGVCWRVGARRRGGYQVCEAGVQVAGVRGRCRIKAADLNHGAACNLQGTRRIGAA